VTSLERCVTVSVLHLSNRISVNDRLLQYLGMYRMYKATFSSSHSSCNDVGTLFRHKMLQLPNTR
jgi:hypothetical protein